MGLSPVLAGANQNLGYFDDLVVGDRYEVGAITISREEALAFAQVYDPLSFHIDEEKARHSMFGGLIVSGLQSIAVVHALSVKGGFLDEDSIVCGAGIDELRFLRPIRPGDTLVVTAEVTELKPGRRDPGRGIARLQYWVKTQDEALAMTFIDNHVVRYRKPI